MVYAIEGCGRLNERVDTSIEPPGRLRTPRVNNRTLRLSLLWTNACVDNRCRAAKMPSPRSAGQHGRSWMCTGEAWPRPYGFRNVRDCHSLEIPWFEQRVASFMTNHMGCLRQNARMILDGISICASATVMRPRSRHSSRILSESSGSSGSSSASKHSVSMFFSRRLFCCFSRAIKRWMFRTN